MSPPRAHMASELLIATPQAYSRLAAQQGDRPGSRNLRSMREVPMSAGPHTFRLTARPGGEEG